MKPNSPVPIGYLNPFFERWQSVLAAGEIGNVYFLPHDITYRTYQFRDWCAAHHFPHTLFNLQADILDDPKVFREALTGTKGSIGIIAQSFFLTNPDARRFLAIIADIRLSQSKGILLYHEGFPSVLFPVLMGVPSSLHQHHIIFPQYPRTALDGFIDGLSKDWSITVSHPERETIAQICSGNFWLATDILRALREKRSLNIRSYAQGETFRKKIQMFWESLPESHRSCLTYPSSTLATDATIDELKKFRIIEQNGTIPEYLSWIIKDEQAHTIVIKESMITYRNQDISHHFSRGERRVLLALSEHEGTPVSRPILGETFWGKETQKEYSDWALDKLMSRLRKKLSQLKLPVTITTLRGKGYVYRRS